MTGGFPSLDERTPGQVVRFNGQPPVETTVLQVGDRIVAVSGAVQAVMRVLEIPGSRVYAELEAWEPDLPEYREHWSVGDTWWLTGEHIHEVRR